MLVRLIYRSRKQEISVLTSDILHNLNDSLSSLCESFSSSVKGKCCKNTIIKAHKTGSLLTAPV